MFNTPQQRAALDQKLIKGKQSATTQNLAITNPSTDPSSSHHPPPLQQKLDPAIDLARLVSFREARPNLAPYLSQRDLTDMLKIMGYDRSEALVADYADAVEGILHPSSALVPLAGMENATNTCYIDSLLFALFARESVFDPLLTRMPPNNDPRVLNLQTSLRLVINQLRLGRLVSRWTMSRLRRDLLAAGWTPSSRNPTGQEDTSELYLFLTTVLRAPFLPVEKTLFHGGRFDTDDERVVTERMLQLSIPEKEEEGDAGGGASSGIGFGRRRGAARAANSTALLLEDLLMSYFFNNKVNVQRAAESKGAGMEMIFQDAWQMNRLLPFFTPQNEAGDSINDATTAEFGEHPVVLPMMLKRYRFSKSGKIKRVGRHVLVPPEIPFGLFVMREEQHGGGGGGSSATERLSDYTLRLRSVVCHAGEDPRSGHYVAYMRIGGWGLERGRVGENKSEKRASVKTTSQGGGDWRDGGRGSDVGIVGITNETEAGSVRESVGTDDEVTASTENILAPQQPSAPPPTDPLDVPIIQLDSEDFVPGTPYSAEPVTLPRAGLPDPTYPVPPTPIPHKTHLDADDDIATIFAEVMRMELEGDGAWLKFDDLVTTDDAGETSTESPSPPRKGAGVRWYGNGKVKLLTSLRDVTAAFEYMSANGYILFYELVGPDQMDNSAQQQRSRRPSARARSSESRAPDETLGAWTRPRALSDPSRGGERDQGGGDEETLRVVIVDPKRPSTVVNKSATEAEAGEKDEGETRASERAAAKMQAREFEKAAKKSNPMCEIM
ncbi:hypothetical protein BJ742DRAFT_793226 [Cladochytrium replicatum]|nr:hypothetical protein BJ742DRAFT_793226 [Cladochytrium replicatum]